MLQVCDVAEVDTSVMQSGGNKGSPRHQALKSEALDRPVQALHCHRGRRHFCGPLSPSVISRMVAASAHVVDRTPYQDDAAFVPLPLHSDAADRFVFTQDTILEKELLLLYSLHCKCSLIMK